MREGASAYDRPWSSGRCRYGGVGEGVALILSVVVFGLGVAALVARDELRAPTASLEVARAVPASSSPVAGHAWSPARDGAR
jgi:hypothetical protein